MNHLTDETLNEYLDDELPNRAEVELHLSQCVGCAARLTALRALFDEIESLPESALSHSLAAPFTRRNAGFALPRWLRLTVILQAAVAAASLVVAVPFVASLFPVIEPPSLTDLFIEVQSQWMIWLDALSQFQVPALPQYSFSLEVSSLFLTSTLAGLSIFWVVGNGLLLRNQINKRRIP